MKLPVNLFVRVHRSFIISILYFEAISRYTISIGESEIPVSESYRKSLFAIIDSNS